MILVGGGLDLADDRRLLDQQTTKLQDYPTMKLTQLLKLLVETESPSHDKAAVDRVGAIVAEEARKLGATIKLIPNQEMGDHVLARFAPSGAVGAIEASDMSGILLLCHMDTVFALGTIQKTPYRADGDKIFGPGTSDMKAGIVIALGAIEEAQKLGLNRPVTLLCTSDEEIGSHTSRMLIESLAKESALVLVMEPAPIDGSLKTWRKGTGSFRVKTHGRAAHSGGDHRAGRNAIEEMAHQIIAIQKLTDYSRQTTLNVGVIQGGTVSNVVPEECSIQVDVRVMQPGEWERVEVEMKNLRPVLDGTTIEVKGRLNRPPMPFDDTMQVTFEKAQSIAAQIGIHLTAGGTGGASDGNFVAALGIPLLDGMGAVGEGYHSEREYIFANSLEQKVKLVAKLLEEW
ncbi:MAG TPA: M20 family metallopeptidase [Anaerolineales bacterium]|nr:M20 family metallopeptidase [Anaerolineales bacterium]